MFNINYKFEFMSLTVTSFTLPFNGHDRNFGIDWDVNYNHDTQCVVDNSFLTVQQETAHPLKMSEAEVLDVVMEVPSLRSLQQVLTVQQS